ncbi:MAG TPA: M23 family metallopeptidase [Candidatus Limnocylindria bacterium]|nr:M23 family metallopeptidase [Candidatus Limnocylindria bacterium]
MWGKRSAIWIALLALAAELNAAAVFQFPTANQALLEPGGGERFFVGTAGKPWTSGQFGCVRSEGYQFHEGLDIRCLQRDKHGEPIDPVCAAADGTVAYVNAKPALSPYGNYVLLRHQVEGLEVYSLYAHLSAVRAGLTPGVVVRRGELIATMGRTSNTRQTITKDRAHCHFELDVLGTDRYVQWHQARLPEQRNDHGVFNGFNLFGLDPARLFHEEARLGTNFSLVRFLQSEPVLCRVAVRVKSFPYLRRYPSLVVRNPVAERQGVAGYELELSFNGLPLRITPRAASELKSPAKVTLLSVNEAEQKSRPCGKLVLKRGESWTLLAHGQQLIDQITY